MELFDAPIPQAVVCSHHPELIDYFGADAVLLQRDLGLVKAGKPAYDKNEDGLKLSKIVARGWED